MVNLAFTCYRQTLACLFLVSAALFFYSGSRAAAENLLPPLTPIVFTPANGSVSSNNSPTYSGTIPQPVPPGTQIIIYVDGVNFGTVTPDALGNWSFTSIVPLPDGPHTVYAVAIDGTGSSPNSNTNTFIIDTLPPPAPIVATPVNGSTTSSNKPTYTGTADPGSTVIIFVDGAPLGTTTASAAGNWTFTPVIPLTNGQHTVFSRAADEAGNTSPNSNTNTFTVSATTAAAVIASGRVATASGRGISKAAVQMNDADGQIRTVLTNPFGYYRFDSVPAGATIVFSVSAKNYVFSRPVRIVTLTEEADGINFTADETAQ